MGSRDARVVITIDGPAGTGKSTVARRLAKALGLEFLDTGAMYRAVALLAIEQAIDPTDGPALATAFASSGFRFDWTADPPRTMLGERPIDDRIRSVEVADVVSFVAAQPAVRAVLVERQRRIADEHPRLVTEGRDQGSVVFPDAPVRFYLDADVEVRARRRVSQMASGGERVAEGEVMSGIRERDRLDSSRSESPLVRPEGAILVDTSTRTLEEVVAHLETETRRRLPDAGLRP